MAVKTTDVAPTLNAVESTAIAVSEGASQEAEGDPNVLEQRFQPDDCACLSCLLLNSCEMAKRTGSLITVEFKFLPEVSLKPFAAKQAKKFLEHDVLLGEL